MFNEYLQYAKQANWENILEKIEPRALSLYGRVIILNTLILSNKILLK